MANNKQIIFRAKFLNGLAIAAFAAGCVVLMFRGWDLVWYAMALLAASPILHFCGLRVLERLDD